MTPHASLSFHHAPRHLASGQSATPQRSQRGFHPRTKRAGKPGMGRRRRARDARLSLRCARPGHRHRAPVAAWRSRAHRAYGGIESMAQAGRGHRLTGMPPHRSATARRIVRVAQRANVCSAILCTRRLYARRSGISRRGNSALPHDAQALAFRLFTRRLDAQNSRVVIVGEEFGIAAPIDDDREHAFGFFFVQIIFQFP